MNLRWVTSESANCYYAADVLLAGGDLADPALASALEPPLTALKSALTEWHVSERAFLPHVIPLAADNRGAHDIAQVALSKVLGSSRAQLCAGRVGGLLTDLRIAFERAVPDVGHVVQTNAEPMRQWWDYYGPSVQGGIARWAGPESQVAEATVALFFPVRAGGGCAFPACNLACLEAVAKDPVADLPEGLRLAWLLSQLNLDLPRYREDLAAESAADVVGLAMIPITLTAAEEAGLLRFDADIMERAVKAWTPTPEAGTLTEWWNVYRDTRPDLAVGLRALDELLS